MSLNNTSTSCIFINTTNNISTNPSQIIMNFPTAFRATENLEICIGSLFIYYSWFNITAAFNNTTFSYTWNGQTFQISVLPGYYAISDLLNYLQLQMINNGTYLIQTVNGVSTNLFFLSFVANPVYYATTLTSTPLPSVIGSGTNYTTPANWPFTSTTTTNGLTPQLNFNSSNFNLLLGFNTNTSYPPTPINTNYYVNSGIPEISPVISCSVNCNMVSNGVINSSGNGTSLLQFSTGNSTFGSQVSPPIYQYQWYQVVPSTYSQLVISFTDQNGIPLAINDTAITLTLMIRNRNRMGY